MLANFLEKSKPINFIFYLGLFFCCFLFSVFTNLTADVFTWVKVIENISFLLLFLAIFFFYHFVVTKNKLTFDHSYSFFLFTLAIVLFTSKLLDFKILTSLLVYLLFLRKLYSLRSSKNVLQKIFDSGFWLGILCILEPFSMLFFVLIYAAILLHQKITIHNLITPIIAFISPLIIFFSYFLWNNTTEVFFNHFYLKLSYTFSIYSFDATLYVFTTVLLLAFFSILLKSPKTLSVNNTFKKSWLLLIINTVITVLFALAISKKNGTEIVFFLVPASIIIANGFEVIQKNYIKNILWCLLIAATIITFFWL
ncbi:MAG: DUF6427 family protein [Polaribacter sp.]|uniref:DUF6427 family protein n=1 Tax=Polaribacter sp. TaxID=1920175 RepID=UPI0032638B3F